MQTLECPQCGAPVKYDSNFATAAHCPYCQSQVALPNEFQIEQIVMPKIDITIGPQVARTASRALWFVFLIPIIIVTVEGWFAIKKVVFSWIRSRSIAGTKH